MRQIVFVLLAVVALGGVLAYTAPLSGQSAGEAAPIYGIKIPAGYRDWKLISVAHEEGNFNDLRAQLGNDVAINAYREGKLPFPDGTIIAALHWHYVSSEENNKAFGRAQSFIAGSPTNIQFMVKDSKKYAGTGGWGFADFTDGKPADEAMHRTCFPCPRARQGSRLCLHPLRTLIPSVIGTDPVLKRCGGMSAGGARAAADDAGDRLSLLHLLRSVSGTDRRSISGRVMTGI